MDKRPDCVFDSIIAGSAPAHLVLDEPDIVAFLDSRPLFTGHTLVVPRRHYPTVSDLSAPLAGAMWTAAVRVAAAQREVLGAVGTFFGLNDLVSQSVPHVHLHVVPRRPGDGLKGFFWPRSHYPDQETAARTAGALRDALASPSARATRSLGHSRPECPEAGAIRVRPAVPSDAAVLAGILAGGSMIPSSYDASDVAAYGAALEEIAGQPSSVVLVAEVGGAVVGMCQLIMFRHLQARGGRCAEIESMHVSSGHRGNGVGTVLLNAAVDAARRAGCYRVQLTSNKARIDAHRFYERHGFEASHEGFKLYLRPEGSPSP